MNLWFKLVLTFVKCASNTPPLQASTLDEKPDRFLKPVRFNPPLHQASTLEKVEPTTALPLLPIVIGM